MLILDLTTGKFSEPDPDQQDNYPDEVLDSEWNPVLTEIQSIQSIEQETSKPDPAVVEAALARLNRN
ncbi:MAG: hypothetical protein ABFS45_10045 [Pseudomonadota bacterium]